MKKTKVKSIFLLFIIGSLVCFSIIPLMVNNKTLSPIEYEISLEIASFSKATVISDDDTA